MKTIACHWEKENMIEVPVVATGNLVGNMNSDITKFLQSYQL